MDFGLEKIKNHKGINVECWMIDFGLEKIKRRKERRGMIKEKRLNDF